jgi:hypothetical protein
MFTRRSTIRGVAFVAIAAVAMLWLVPPEHRHPALAGRSAVIHRHTIVAVAQQTASSVDHDDHGDDDHHSNPENHGDHSDAQILKTVFTSAHKYVPDSPVVTQATVVIAPSWHVAGFTALRYESTCHDPPKRPTSLRAPPV